jgi:hypothetical protein
MQGGKGTLKRGQKTSGTLKESSVITIESTDEEEEQAEAGRARGNTRAAAAQRKFVVSRRSKASALGPSCIAAVKPSVKQCISEEESDVEEEEPSAQVAAQNSHIELKASKKRSVLELISGVRFYP